MDQQSNIRTPRHATELAVMLCAVGSLALFCLLLQAALPDHPSSNLLAAVEQADVVVLAFISIASLLGSASLHSLSRMSSVPTDIYQSLISGTEGGDIGELIFEVDPSCMKIIDGYGTLLAINNAGLGMLECDSLDAVIGQPVYDLLQPSHREPFAEMIEHTLAGECTEIEFEVDTFKNNRRWFRQVARNYFCKQTKQNVLFCITRDITESKINKDRLDLAIDVTNQGLWDENLITDRLFYNSNWFTMLGYDPDELPMTSKAWRDLVHPDDLDRTQKEFDRHADGCTPTYSCEYRMRAKDGTWKWIRDSGRIVERTENNSPARAIGVHVDIDATKRHELTLGSVVSFVAAEEGITNLTGLCRSIAEAYDVDSVGISKLTGENHATVVAGWSDGKPTAEFVYDLDDTPCSVASATSYCHYERDICTEFPNDHILVEMRASAYSGLSLCDSNGDRIGILYVISSKQLPHTAELESTLRLVGARAASELERQIIRDSLQTSEDRLKLAMQTAKFGHWEWNAGTGELFIADEIFTMLGYDAGDHPDTMEWWNSVCHPDDPTLFQKTEDSSPSTECRTIECELRLKKADGTWNWFKNNSKVVCSGSDKKPGRIVGLLSDTNSSKLDQIELEHTRSLLEETGKMANVGGWELMLPDKSLRWTDQTYRIHELEIGSPLDLDTAIGFYTEDSQEQIAACVTRCLQDGTPWDVELRLRTAKGNEIWIRTVGVLEERDGVQHRLYGSFQDITESKNTLLKLEETKDAAEAASRAKSEFLANMSHEIRTPMTAILGNADLLAHNDEYSTNHKLHEDAINSIGKNAEHLLAIINDILDSSKIEAGMLQLECVELSPCELISDSTEMLFTRASHKDIDISVKYTNELPRRVKSDPTRIRQILINLIGNAVKFTNTGSVQVEIGYSPLPNEHGMIKIRVTDTGVGISSSNLDSILMFEAFTQADGSTTREFGGTGLGLRITKSLVEMLGGTLTLSSTPGVGTSATATLQVQPVIEGGMWHPPMKRLDNQAAEESASESLLAANILVDKTILLVEDGEDNQRLLTHMLRSAGVNVVNAVNGADALQVYQNQLANPKSDTIDLVLMDMQMPELDGYDATAALRKIGFSGPIVALTAHAMAGDRERCLAAGCQDYLTKPVRSSTLLEACARQICSDLEFKKPA